jgi:tRNA pseudouridine-54 N-methylase
MLKSQQCLSGLSKSGGDFSDTLKQAHRYVSTAAQQANNTVANGNEVHKSTVVSGTTTKKDAVSPRQRSPILPLLLLLHEHGDPVEQVLSEEHQRIASSGIVCVLGDNTGLTEKELEACLESTMPMVSRRSSSATPSTTTLTDAVAAETTATSAIATSTPPLYHYRVASLGEASLLASQCIVCLHHYLDKIHVCSDRRRETGQSDSDVPSQGHQSSSDSAKRQKNWKSHTPQSLLQLRLEEAQLKLQGKVLSDSDIEKQGPSGTTMPNSSNLN